MTECITIDNAIKLLTFANGSMNNEIGLLTSKCTLELHKVHRSTQGIDNILVLP